jgi:acetolactate synthase-1/2/3 large subunit
MHGNYGANVLTNRADVIVAVGMRFDDRVTGRLDRYARAASVIHIDIDPSEIGKNVPAEVGIVADAEEALGRLLPLVAARSRPGWLEEFRRHDRIEHEAVNRTALAPEGPALGMSEVIARLAELTDGDAVIVTDVGQHQMHAARHFRFRHPLTHVTSGGLGTMGFALPAALGATFARPGRPVIAIAGDGGFQMSLQELGTCMQERAPVKAIILNNDYLGMVRQWQSLFFQGRYSEVRLENPDFVRIAEGYRIPAERVSERAALEPALRRMLETDGPFLLDVAVAAEENVFPMVPAGDGIDQIRLRPDPPPTREEMSR